MKKRTASASALVLAGIGTVGLAAPGGAQSAEDIPSYPAVPLEAENVGGFQDTVELDSPGFDHAMIRSVDPCPVDGHGEPGGEDAEGTLLAGIAIEIWAFDEDGEPVLLDEGYAASEHFLGLISEEERARWDALNPDTVGDSVFDNTGEVSVSYMPPAVNGEQTFIAHCLIVDATEPVPDSIEDIEPADEGLVVTYPVTGGEDPGGDDDLGDDDTPPATEPPADDGSDDDPGADDDDDDVSTPTPTPVTGDPSLTG